jgi:hypothetical protein
MQKQGPVVAWIVDDAGFPKNGEHSVGVTRQYCGQVGKQENCRRAVSLSVATWNSSLPIAYRLYLPKELGPGCRAAGSSPTASPRPVDVRSPLQQSRKPPLGSDGASAYHAQSLVKVHFIPLN